MFAGTLRLFRRQMTVSTGKPIHTASSQITFAKAENILAIGAGFLGLVMLGYEIMSVRDVTKSLDELKVDMKAELKNIESRLHAQQERTDSLMKIQQERTDNLYKVLSEEQKQNGQRFHAQQERTDSLVKIQQERTDNLYKVLLEEQKQSGERFYSLLREIQKKG